MKVKDLLNGVDILESYNLDKYIDNVINNITNDSREVNESSIFIAICGKHSDGHDYLHDVFKKGCKVSIVNKIDKNIDIAQIKVKDSRESMSILSNNYFNNPSSKMKVIGITATNGKTTASFMLDEVFKACGLKTGLIGTVKVKSDDEVIPSNMTTPEAFKLQSYFKKMEEKNVDVVTMEVSSLALEQKRAFNVDFDIVTFNNFNREHIDEHGSFEAYWRAKSSLITNAKEDSVAILNYDDENILKLKVLGHSRQIFYSVKSDEADIYAKDINLESDNPSFVVVITKDIVLKDKTIKKQDFKVKLSIPGYHTVINAMSCISIALALGLDNEKIAEGIKNFRGLERRFELIYNDGYKILDDHFANNDNINVTLDSLSKLKYNDLYMVYALRGNRGVTVNRENIETLSDWIPKLKLKQFIATESLNDVSKKDLVHKEEKEIFFETCKDKNIDVTFKERLQEAIELAIDKAKKGDVILLAGCQGMDKGGRLALNYIASNCQSESEKERILNVLKDRICG